MPHFKIHYPGELRTEVIHVPSLTKIYTDAPTDNMGKGESFSPTDLLAVALATCMITTMSIKARLKGFDIEGTIADVKKIMTSSPRRVAEVVIEIDFPFSNFTAEQKELLEETAHTCPVALSLNEAVKQTMIFNYH
ncbi:MAG: OsmC family protein [Bacteroidia bacterium]|nr:OsmC family protein [Bacteroidia bacterium]MCZ2276986.1 OsmC family protein [Bacteroidia bacterium]